MRIFYDNLVDMLAATITASSAAAAYPVTRLAHPHRSKPWRSVAGDAADVVEIDLGSECEAGACILLDHDLTEADDVTVEAGLQADYSDAIEVQAEIQTGAPILVIWPAAAVRYVRITIDKSDTRAISVGRLFFGEAADLEQPDDNGLTADASDLSKNSRSLGGQIYSEERPSYRSWKIPLSTLSEEQMVAVITARDYCKQVRPFFLQIQDGPAVANEDPIDEVVYVRFKDLPKPQLEGVNGAGLSWKCTMDVDEEL